MPKIPKIKNKKWKPSNIISTTINPTTYKEFTTVPIKTKRFLLLLSRAFFRFSKLFIMMRRCVSLSTGE